MDETVLNLIGLYAGLVLLNAAISAFIWWSSRQRLQRDLFHVWGAMLVAFVAQGFTGDVFADEPLGIVFGFATLFVANLAFARLIDHLHGTAPPWTWSVGGFVAALIAAAFARAVGAPFTVIALPVALAVAFPLAWSSLHAIVARWKQMSFASRGLMLTCLAITAHTLDYPFLRHRPEFTAIGFTIAIFVVFALSVFAYAVVLEAVTTENARTAAEVDVAHRIQMKVVPRDPSIPGLEIACHMKPAEAVGGDYYDVYHLDRTSWILLGDVTGHGLSSGLVMLMAQSILASILHARAGISPAELTFLANQILYRNLRRLDELRSMTLVALCRVGDDQRFVYSGNHDHVFIYRAATGTVETVAVRHTPHDLGFLDEFPMSAYEQSSFSLLPGDLLLLATDGVVEAARRGRYESGMFEAERVCTLLRQLAGRPLAEIKAKLLDELEQFTGGVYHDDVTFVLARPVPAQVAA